MNTNGMFFILLFLLGIFVYSFQITTQVREGRRILALSIPTVFIIIALFFLLKSAFINTPHYNKGGNMYVNLFGVIGIMGYIVFFGAVKKFNGK